VHLGHAGVGLVRLVVEGEGRVEGWGRGVGRVFCEGAQDSALSATAGHHIDATAGQRIANAPSSSTVSLATWSYRPGTRIFPSTPTRVDMRRTRSFMGSYTAPPKRPLWRSLVDPWMLSSKAERPRRPYLRGERGR